MSWLTSTWLILAAHEIKVLVRDSNTLNVKGWAAESKKSENDSVSSKKSILAVPSLAGGWHTFSRTSTVRLCTK